MKKTGTFSALLICFLTNCIAQQFIPFQYQNKSKWNFQEKWGLMTTDKKIVIPPTYYNIAPSVVKENFIRLGKNIVEVKTGKVVWDSIDSKDVQDIRGNIVRIRMPLRGAVNYQPYSFKNLATKKLIAQEGRWSGVSGYVISENSLDGEAVVDENGKEIVSKKSYQKISNKPTECFVVVNEYNSTNDIFDKKGNKLNKINYDKIEIEYGTKPIMYATNLIDKQNRLYEMIFINPEGKEVPQHLFYKGKINSKVITDGIFKMIDSTFLFTNKNCDEVNRLSSCFVVNQSGKIIINDKEVGDIELDGRNNFVAVSKDQKTTIFYDDNGVVLFKTDAYKNVREIGNNLFFATAATDNKKYFINKKGERMVNGAAFNSGNLVRCIDGKGFMIYKEDIKKLFFNTYDPKTGQSNFGEQIKLGDSIKVEDFLIVNANHYLVKVADYTKKQYAIYIYDVRGNLALKSEDGLWMNVENKMYVKYTLNAKGDKFFKGYYDENLQPYSIIEE